MKPGAILPLFTYSAIAVTVIASVVGFSNKSVMEKSVFSVRAIIREKEFYRMLSSLLFHVNWMHLIFNMISLYSFAESVESLLGSWLVASIYLASGITGGILALVLKRKNPGYAAVGASGAVCGVIFASVFLIPGGSVMILPIPIPIPSWAYALLFVLISIYGIGRENSSIGHEAHLGGALCGIAGAILYRPEILQQQYLLLVGVTVPVAAMLVYFVFIKK